jgi:beta-galactosidase
LLVCVGLRGMAQPFRALDTLRYGAAYYYEYMPKERLAEDVRLMKAAGINTVRLAESTWGVWEPQDGIFDFSKLDRVLDAMEAAGIDVIIGTPTYAMPAWLAREHPEVLVSTSSGQATYGARQNMDIVSPVFRRYAERIIRKLVGHVRDRRCVIGYQADNETKSYNNNGPVIQALFRQSLRQRFGPPEAMNRIFGLNYWSNSIHDWADFPSIKGNVNASLGCAFAAFQRAMVTDYLAWQVRIIRSLKRPDQFITHNFDLEWRESSYGIQPAVDHFAAARAFDIAGIDIYHPTEDRLDGSEIAFGGDLARSMKRANYLVMETQAQSLAGRQELPYPGQLRLQAYSHLASGADMVEYWPWMSLPNAVETYWKGVLSHDGEPNAVYDEVAKVGGEFRRVGDRLVHLKKKNRVALLFSNESLTALGWFPFSDSLGYNDILRREYDALYRLNIGCDLINTAASSAQLNEYALIVVPSLYSVADSVLEKLNAYVRQGGHIVYSCKSGFTDENVQVRIARMPGPLREAVGASYQLFTNIDRLPLQDNFGEVSDWAELLVPETAAVVGQYAHPYWGRYAAITRNKYGRGTVMYIGSIPVAATMLKLLRDEVAAAGCATVDQQLSFPLIVRSGVNVHGHTIHYYFNYSGEERSFVYPHGAAVDVLAGGEVSSGATVHLEPWGVAVLEEQGWTDTEGHLIDAHGAGVLYHDGVYYLFGEIKKGSTRLVPNQGWEDYRVPAGGVSCYSSRDLVHWKNEGAALAPVVGDSSSDLDTGRVIERPKVIYNSRTGKYVMWMHIDRNDYSYARAGVAVSDRPQGPYKYLGSVRPNGQMARDMTVFQDQDGRAYLVYASENNNTMQVCLLSDDYLRPTEVYRRILVGQRREAPAVFKSGGRYYLITSLCSGWDPNAATFAVADSLLGEWQQQGNPCVGAGADTTFGAQSTFVLPLGAHRFLFMADRWNKTDLERSGYLWLPLRVDGGRVVIEGPGAGSGSAVGGLGDAGSGGERYVIGPLALLNYDMRVKGKGAGYSFLRCYNERDSLLLEYRVPVGDAHSGNYTETPPACAYVRIGVSEGLEVDSLKVELNVGETKAVPPSSADLGQYLRPFWKGDTVVNETVLLYSVAGAARQGSDGVGAAAEGRLLYRPDKILSVKNFALDTTYRSGVDYRIEGRKILRLPGSAMPFRADTSFDKKDLAWYNLQSQWVVVSYTHHDRWAGPVPAYSGVQLPRLMGLLGAGRPVRIVAYGMSITRGMDVSGYDGVAPYMPTYVSLFARAVRERYPRAAVGLFNAGLPGSTVAWGAQYASQYVTPLHPDLVLLDFGMNDFWRMRPEEFRDSVKTMIRKIRAGDPQAEFILLSNLKFDPAYVADSDRYKAFYTGNMVGYHEQLSSLEGPGIVGLDMTDMSDALYARKKAKDCLVNPLHPNDYMARWYAQGLAALVCP